MITVKHLAPKILIAADYCGCQQFAVLAPAYLKKKVQPFIEECTSIASSMTRGVIGALGCGIGSGI